MTPKMGKKTTEFAGLSPRPATRGLDNELFTVSLYIRVSTDRQAKEGDSLEEQESELKKYCDYRGFRIHHILIEKGKSGGNTNRPEYQKLIKDIEAKKIDAVVVKKLDRLSRSLLDFEQLMTTMQANGVEFISLRESFDTTTAMGKAMLRIALVFAQLEREQTSERLRDVLSFRASQGLFNGGMYPYGYTAINKELVPHLKEKKVVEVMIRQFIDLKSVAEVAHFLNDQGYRNRLGKLWDRRQVQRTLQNPLYVGKMKWGDALHQGLHQPLMSEKQFNEIQMIFKSGNRLVKESTTGAYLQKLLWCDCGHAMTPSHSLNKNRMRYDYYRCTSTQSAEKGQSTCVVKYVPLQKTEALILHSVIALSHNPLFQSLENKVLKFNQGIALEVQDLHATLSTFQKQLDTLKRRQDAYLDSLISGTLSTGERKSLSKRLEELEAEEKQIKSSILKTDFEITQKSYEQIDWLFFKQALISFKEDHLQSSTEQLKTYFHHHLKRIVLSPEKVILIFKRLPWPIDILKTDLPQDTS